MSRAFISTEKMKAKLINILNYMLNHTTQENNMNINI